jgi:hypothetical protein
LGEELNGFLPAFDRIDLIEGFKDHTEGFPGAEFIINNKDRSSGNHGWLILFEVCGSNAAVIMNDSYAKSIPYDQLMSFLLPVLILLIFKHQGSGNQSFRTPGPKKSSN